MNFVIFSRNFYPQNDAEAFCSTRFASALTEIGHNVHVVTAEHKSDFDYKELVDSRVKITRAKLHSNVHRYPFLNIRQRMIMEEDMWNVPEFCSTVKNVLKQYDNPILITRTLPITSVIVGYRTRKYAYKWVSHFSDPIPWFPLKGKIFRIRDYLYRRWIKKALLYADAISVTCPLAIRYYQEDYPKEASGKKFFVTTHIGDNKLSAPKSDDWSSIFSRKIVLHPGDMYYNRGEAIFQAVDRINEEGIKLLFVLDRPPQQDMEHWFMTAENAIALGSKGGGTLASRLNINADVIFVPDFVRNFSYSPYLMSKFVYQIYGDRPIVVHAKSESCMADYCRRFKNAGLFFSEAGDVDGLVSALKGALNCDIKNIHREDIRREFSSSFVAEMFVRNVQSI